ncbi:MAG: Uma2 family endonuclease [Pseudomonadota bacterium]
MALPRHKFSVDDCFHMVETGVFSHDYRFELLDGEIVPISPKGAMHITVQAALIKALGKTCPDSVMFAAEPTIKVTDTQFVEPDLFIWPASIRADGINLCDALLVIEIATTSLAVDLGRKAKIYAAGGAPEFWVIDTAKLLIHVHRDPTADGYRS